MTATIKFRAKAETVYNMDDTVAYVEVKVPVIGARHCNMHEFRSHRIIAGFTNSELFPGILKGVLKRLGVSVGGYIRLDQIPEHVSVDTSGFLAAVTIAVPDDANWRG
jgi:hypothetical protein